MEWDNNQQVGTCKRLPVPLDVDRLLADFERVREKAPEAEKWTRGPVHRDAETIFLRGQAPLVGETVDEDHPVLNEAPYLRELVHETFPGRPGKALIAILKPGGLIPPHTDLAHQYFQDTVRIHLPLVTSEKVKFLSGDRFYHWRVGEAWALNNLQRHAVVNGDPTLARCHLIVDVYPNEAMAELLKAGDRPDGEENDDLIVELMNRMRELSVQHTISRNTPCPCGSGKRYKHCHGSLGFLEGGGKPGS